MRIVCAALIIAGQSERRSKMFVVPFARIVGTYDFDQ